MDSQANLQHCQRLASSSIVNIMARSSSAFGLGLGLSQDGKAMRVKRLDKKTKVHMDFEPGFYYAA